MIKQGSQKRMRELRSQLTVTGSAVMGSLWAFSTADRGTRDFTNHHVAIYMPQSSRRYIMANSAAFLFEGLPKW